MRNLVACCLGMMAALGASATLAQEHSGPVPDEGVERRDTRLDRDPDPLGWYVPDFFRIQTGGFVGLFAVGSGYALFDDVVNLTAYYGFTPHLHAGHDVHAFSFDATLRPFDFRIGDVRLVPIYAGGGLLYAWGDEYFSRLPERYRRYEEGYYSATSLHWVARAGIELDWLPETGVFERHGLYYEVTVLDTFFERYRDNPETLDPWDAMAGAVGYRAAF